MSTILLIRSVTALNVVGFVLRQQGGMAVHTYNLSVQETWGKDQKFEASLRYMRPCLKVIFFVIRVLLTKLYSVLPQFIFW